MAHLRFSFGTDMPVALWALAAGAFGIGTGEFVIMGLLPQLSADLGVSLSSAGLLVTGYALGVFIGAPIVTLLISRLPRKTVLLGLMLLFTIGNLACAVAPGYASLMAGRVITTAAYATGRFPGNRRVADPAAVPRGLVVGNTLGGITIDHGPGLGALPWVAALMTVGGLLVALYSRRLDRRENESNKAKLAARGIRAWFEIKHSALPIRSASQRRLENNTPQLGCVSKLRGVDLTMLFAVQSWRSLVPYTLRRRAAD